MGNGTGLLIGALIIGGVMLLSKKGAAVSTTETPGLEKISQEPGSKNSYLELAGIKAGQGDLIGAANAAMAASNAALKAGDTAGAQAAAKQAAIYANQAQEVEKATAALAEDHYYRATEATIAAGVSTAFEIANSGLGGSAAIGDTIEVTGIDGTKTFINCGNGYAEYTSRLANSVAVVSNTDQVALKEELIRRGYVTQEQLNAMPPAQQEVYTARVIANNPSILGEKTRAAVTGDVERDKYGSGAPKEGSARVAYEDAVASGDTKTAAALDKLYNYTGTQ
ncbi:MAG: hypothetical protein JW967_01565 [Dehalococcoidales bacterium]|nr:hypothetical protein [Dehalococcoidales bacterium]